MSKETIAVALAVDLTSNGGPVLLAQLKEAAGEIAALNAELAEERRRRIHAEAIASRSQQTADELRLQLRIANRNDAARLAAAPTVVTTLALTDRDSAGGYYAGKWSME